jgi:hypothetical protein
LPIPLPPVSVRKKKTKAEVEALSLEWDKRTGKQKATGQQRALALFGVEKLQVAAGFKKDAAVKAVAKEIGVSWQIVYIWDKLVRGWPRDAWHMVLSNKHLGKQKSVEISEDAWAYIIEDYLREEAPALKAVYFRASERYENLPSYNTVKRRITEISRPIRVLAREGTEALSQMYPYQERDRSCFGALEAVNADGHKFDVFVKMEDGEVIRPVIAAWQDIYSGKVLSYEIDRTENTDSIRNSFGLMVMEHGIPDHAYLDNGRSFASKWLTGGAPTRYRFKINDDDPLGILTLMGVQTHWCTPYHGQAKPIERAFKDLCCEYIAKDPICAGAYTGSNPNAKPENYGSKAVPIATFRTLVEKQVKLHNAKTGRRSKICAGRSFDDVFSESYAARLADIRRPTEATLVAMLMHADTALVYKNGSHIYYKGNRYFSEPLLNYGGQSVVIRFDPNNLYRGLVVYTKDNRFICIAPCIARTGHNSAEAGREFNRARNQLKSATKLQLKAMKKMNALEAAIPNDLPEPKPAPKQISMNEAEAFARSERRAEPVASKTTAQDYEFEEWTCASVRRGTRPVVKDEPELAMKWEL